MEKEQTGKAKFRILSHTHWDREWYMPFEQFRMKLVDLIDHLLDILKKDNNFIFHLDAQTVVLEDYLEIRPERERDLKKYIASGNIAVGPWYLQNDFYLTSGEATVRNLLRGTAIAEKFGRCTRIAYAPDQFGNVSQLPQIFNGFGMDTFMFGRGYSYYGKDGERIPAPAEFIWQSEDGSECVSVHLTHWYNNAQHIPEELDNAKLLLDINERDFTPINVSPYVVLMNGVDHLEPQEDVPAIAEALREEGYDICQCRMDDYFDELKSWLKRSGAKLSTVRGALLHGGDGELLRGCWSSRIHLKRANVAAQTDIENKVEPLYTYLEQRGLAGAYPRGFTDYIWKNLLRNHPHDSICCCSRDEIANHMEDSYARIEEVEQELLRRGMRTLARHTDMGGEYTLTVFNPTERPYTGVVETDIRFLRSDGVHAFRVLDGKGRACETEVLECGEELFDVFTAMNLPGVLNVDRYRVRIAVENVPPFAAVQYIVEPQNAFPESAPAGAAIENEYYAVGSDGENITLFCKETGVTVENFLRFEDSGDKGDLYIYTPAGWTVSDERRTVQIAENGRLSKSLRLSAVLRVPARYDFSLGRASGETVEIPVSCTLTLEKGSRTVLLDYTLENHAEDHRIRLIVDGGVAAETMTVDSPFDSFEVRESDLCVHNAAKSFCNSTFAAKRGKKSGFALFTEGQHDVENVGGGIAVTVLRSSGAITRVARIVPGEQTGAELLCAGSQWDAPGGQCKQKISGRLGFSAFRACTDAGLFARAKQFRTRLLTWYDARDAHKFTGGRFAVQDAKLAKFYDDKDPFEGKTVALGEVFTLSGDSICVTAYKQSEDKKGAVLRLVNLSSEGAECELSYEGRIFSARLDERVTEEIGQKTVRLAFRPKQIRTILLV